MEHSIALVTGATSGLGHAAARLLARARGHRTGRTWPQLAQPALTERWPERRARRVDFLLLNAGMVPGKERVLTAAGVEAAQATLSGHHQLTVGLLHSPSN